MNVRVRGRSGKHMLALSSSPFDPRQTLRLTLARCAPGGARQYGRLGAVASRHLRSTRLDSDLGSHALQRSETKNEGFEAQKLGVVPSTEVRCEQPGEPARSGDLSDAGSVELG